MVQLAPAASEVPQLLLCEKSPALAPVIAIPLMVAVVVKVLLSEALWPGLELPTTWLLKVMLDGKRFRPEVFPVPVRLAVCGLVAALSLTVRVPFRVPPSVGVKVTLMERVVPAASMLPQLLLCPKSP